MIKIEFFDFGKLKIAESIYHYYYCFTEEDDNDDDKIAVTVVADPTI